MDAKGKWGETKVVTVRRDRQQRGQIQNGMAAYSNSYTVRIRRNNEDDLTFSRTKRCNGTDDGKAPLENRTVDTEANTILRVDSSRAAYFEFAEKKGADMSFVTSVTSKKERNENSR
jgi:hypothetical protein